MRLQSGAVQKIVVARGSQVMVHIEDALGRVMLHIVLGGEGVIEYTPAMDRSPVTPGVVQDAPFEQSAGSPLADAIRQYHDLCRAKQHAARP